MLNIHVNYLIVNQENSVTQYHIYDSLLDACVIQKLYTNFAYCGVIPDNQELRAALLIEIRKFRNSF